LTDSEESDRAANAADTKHYQEIKMPFPTQNSQPFTRAGVEWLNPNQNGCYGIYRQGSQGILWIYVGKGDLRANLLAHFNGDNPDILRYNPTHYVTEVTAAMDRREKELQIEYKPVANKRIG
jgi:hypothetical protein